MRLLCIAHVIHLTVGSILSKIGAAIPDDIQDGLAGMADELANLTGTSSEGARVLKKVYHSPTY